MLRTHKLGEADRIITLLTRHHGRVRAVAKGVRKTTSRWGSRLEPFTHVDLQLAVGRSLDIVTQAETIEPFAVRARQRLRALHRRHGDARDRRPAGHRGGPAGGPAVPAARRRAARDDRGRPEHQTGRQPGARLLPAALAGGGRLRAVVQPLRPLRRRRAAQGVQPVGRRSAVRRLPGARLGVARRAARSTCSARCSPATGTSSRRPTRGRCARPPAWCRPTCTGTSSAACGRWSTSSAEARSRLVALHEVVGRDVPVVAEGRRRQAHQPGAGLRADIAVPVRR